MLAYRILDKASHVGNGVHQYRPRLDKPPCLAGENGAWVYG